MNNKAFRKPKLVVILGQTSSGKSDLAVKLARKFNGEVVSADSRQVYKKMDLGTGKVTKKEMQGIPHYLLDVASPKKRFTASQYQNLAKIAIKKIIKRGRLPILCGGTGFYIKTLIDDLAIPAVKPDWKLRKKLEKKPVKELYRALYRLDRQRAKNIDRFNPRRLIRAIEIVQKSKAAVPPLKTNPSSYNVLFIGIKRNFPELAKRIKKRLLLRLKKGMISEVKRLKKSGISWKKLEGFGLEYRWLSYFLQKKVSFREMIERLSKEIEHYAKRQMTWFKKDKRIYWVKNYKGAEKLVEKFTGSV